VPRFSILLAVILMPNLLAPVAHSRLVPWYGPLLAALLVLWAGGLYVAGAAPGLTWAHEAADGGELVTAAIVNGVPHPPGYPLYMLLLQAWLWLAQVIDPGGDLVRQAAWLSALCAALSVGVTLAAAHHLLAQQAERDPMGPPIYPLLWAALAAAAWAISPLLWSQAVVAEVYGLHALLIALLGWVVLVHPDKLWVVAVVVALGVANHLTTLLLLPAAIYAIWTRDDGQDMAPSAGRALESNARILAIDGAVAAGLVLGALFYLRIPWAAGAAPPINWGYADNWQGFWWLVSGAAYRGYLFDDLPASLLPRIAGWAYTITAQYTPVGLALALLGLAYWDRTAAHLRNFSLLWLLPVSAYTVAYNTRDSDIYLLAAGWIMALWLAVGMAQVGGWIVQRWPQPQWGRAPVGVVLLAAAFGIGLAGLAGWRWPQTALGADRAARDYLAQVAAVVEPGSIVVTLEDRETFALWYGVWGSQASAEHLAGVIPVNDSLYQFDWYRRLQADLHPEIAGIGESVGALIATNRGVRPIYFAQLPAPVAESELTPAGPLWRLKE